MQWHCLVCVLAPDTRCVLYLCSGIVWFVCLPLTHIVDVPDSMFEVMSALLLVAAINYVVIYASKLSLK